VNDGDKSSVQVIDGSMVMWSDMMRTDSKVFPKLPEASSLGIQSDDPVMILFSSGTTGPQKAVVLSNRNIHSQMVLSWSVHLSNFIEKCKITMTLDARRF
jgi:acyl-coenzyme A synthetase/AMP-(fatty) acid ligase